MAQHSPVRLSRRRDDQNMSGYLRGFGISLMPALITMICVCGIRFY
ncbi:MAG: hypothetical protein UC928_04200 [Collinsella sp.]|nr:hypothetical protein [Collinsella sp.]